MAHEENEKRQKTLEDLSKALDKARKNIAQLYNKTYDRRDLELLGMFENFRDNLDYILNGG